MMNIVACPQCAEQLGFPTAAVMAAVVECPACQAVFSLCETDPISLPEARTLSDSTPSLDFQLDFDFPASEANQEQPLNLELPDSFFDTTRDDSRQSDVQPTTAFVRAVADIATATSSSLVRHAPLVESMELPSEEFDLGGNEGNRPTELRSPLEMAPLEMAPSEMAPSEMAPLAMGDATAADEMPAEAANDAVGCSEALVQAVTLGRAERHGLPRIAALAAGPVLGSLLGLYGLFWLPGGMTNSLGLARATPESGLPVRLLDSGSGSLPAKASKDNLGKASGDSSLSRALTTHTQEPVLIKRDDPVMTVSVVQPVTPVASIVLITASEFSRLVEDASAALPAIMTGDLSERASVRPKGHAYMTLCRLAEQFDFANQLGLAPALQEKVSQAKRIFQQVAADPVARRDLVHIASRWWEYQQRPNSGVFLLGRVHNTRPAGAGMLCWLQVGDQSPSEAIPVLLKESRYQAGDLIGVVGSVISNQSDMPAELPADLSIEQMVRATYDYHLQAGI